MGAMNPTNPKRSQGLRALLRPHASRLFIVFGLSAIAAAGEAVGLALFSVLLNAILDLKTRGATPGIIGVLTRFMEASPRVFFGLLAVTYIGKSILTLVSNYVSIAVSLKIADGWRMRLLRALLHMPLRGIPTKQGVAVQLVLDEPVVAGQGLASGGILVQNVISAATIYATLLWLSPTTTLILTCIALVAMFVLMQVFRYSRTLGVERTEAYTTGYSYMTEMLGSLRQLKLFGLENRVEKHSAKLINRIRLVVRRSLALSSSPRIIIELVFVVVFVLVLAVLAPRMTQAAMLTSVGLAAVAAMRLLPSFSAAAGIWVQVQQAFPAMSHIQTELERLEQAAELPITNGQPLAPMRDAIELRNVEFSYPERPAVLKGVSLRIEAGKFTAVVGPSGSGKSTLFELLCGLHDPDAGQILVDGVDLATAPKVPWRQQQLGIVPQDGFLMSGTIRENLLLLHPDCPEPIMLDAVKAVGAELLISHLPGGYDTMIGERGISLSGGQRQRLALARVLVREPGILLLDEATSALDAESDEAVFQALERYRGKMTIIAIAHRLSSIRNADRIFFMLDGQVAESGSHEELLKRNGPYAALYRASDRPDRKATSHGSRPDFPSVTSECAENNDTTPASRIGSHRTS
jgi:ABC-type multidrug transport system fused ATPase/permease subunit